MPITWNRKTPCKILGITYLPTGERQISWPINSPISRSDPLHVRLWERDTLIRVWIFVPLATLEDINWGHFLIWFSLFFRLGGLNKDPTIFKTHSPLSWEIPNIHLDILQKRTGFSMVLWHPGAHGFPVFSGVPTTAAKQNMRPNKPRKGNVMRTGPTVCLP